MSYDTTVHDALDPPASRVTDDRDRRTRSPKLVLQRRIAGSVAIAIASLFLLGGINWTVAKLSPPTQPPLRSAGETVPLNLSQPVSETSIQLHGRP